MFCSLVSQSIAFFASIYSLDGFCLAYDVEPLMTVWAAYLTEETCAEAPTDMLCGWVDTCTVLLLLAMY